MVVREAAAAAASATAPATEISKEEDGSSSAAEAEAAEPPLQTEARFSHNMGPSEFVHMQLAASVAGLAFKDPASMLSIHPTFGPWLSLRSVVVLDVDGSTIADPTPVKHPRPDVIPKVEARLAELLAPPPAPRLVVLPSSFFPPFLLAPLCVCVWGGGGFPRLLIALSAVCIVDGKLERTTVCRTGFI